MSTKPSCISKFLFTLEDDATGSRTAKLCTGHQMDCLLLFLHNRATSHFSRNNVFQFLCSECVKSDHSLKTKVSLGNLGLRSKPVVPFFQQQQIHGMWFPRETPKPATARHLRKADRRCLKADSRPPSLRRAWLTTSRASQYYSPSYLQWSPGINSPFVTEHLRPDVCCTHTAEWGWVPCVCALMLACAFWTAVCLSNSNKRAHILHHGFICLCHQLFCTHILVNTPTHPLCVSHTYTCTWEKK